VAATERVADLAAAVLLEEMVQAGVADQFVRFPQHDAEAHTAAVCIVGHGVGDPLGRLRHLGPGLGAPVACDLRVGKDREMGRGVALVHPAQLQSFGVQDSRG
jgi:hypothetical protein